MTELFIASAWNATSERIEDVPGATRLRRSFPWGSDQLRRQLIRMIRLLFLAASLVLVTIANAQVWATATSTHPANGRVIVFRYIKEFMPGFSKAAQPIRAILVWKYNSEKGLPAVQERQSMDAMEDILAPEMKRDDFATLALVSTGENLREWTYYVKSEDEFMMRLNRSLSVGPRYPIEVHVASDPSWSTYEKFRARVKQ